jgi:hypothetical protein
VRVIHSMCACAHVHVCGLHLLFLKVIYFFFAESWCLRCSNAMSRVQSESAAKTERKCTQMYDYESLQAVCHLPTKTKRPTKVSRAYTSWSHVSVCTTVHMLGIYPKQVVISVYLKAWVLRTRASGSVWLKQVITIAHMQEPVLLSRNDHAVSWI